MSTLNVYGFTPRKARSSFQPCKIMDKNPTAAFIQPVDLKPVVASVCNDMNKIQTKKPLVKKSSKKVAVSTSKKITQYFNVPTTSMDIDTELNVQEEQEEPVVCVLRKRLPFDHLLKEIQDEFMQEYGTLAEETEILNTPKNKGKCRKFNQIEDTTVALVKRRKATVDHDLSKAMQQFLILKSNIIYKPMNTSHLFSEFKQEQDQELIRPTLRHKMSIYDSDLFMLQIAQDFLYS